MIGRYFQISSILYHCQLKNPSGCSLIGRLSAWISNYGLSLTLQPTTTNKIKRNMAAQLRVRRAQPQSRLSATTLEHVRAATGFDTITTVGPYSIRSPLTNRINRLETERDVLRFEECAEVMVGRARFLHQGLDGHSFRRVQAHESTGKTMWEYRLPLFIFIVE